MQIYSVNNSQNFKGLDYKNVLANDKTIIEKELPKLKQLGEKYDIKLTSSFYEVPDFAAIDISVRPLKSALSLWQRIFGPVGKASFKTGAENKEKTLSDSVEKAIADYANQNKLGELIDTFE